MKDRKSKMRRYFGIGEVGIYRPSADTDFEGKAFRRKQARKAKRAFIHTEAHRIFIARCKHPDYFGV